MILSREQKKLIERHFYGVEDDRASLEQLQSCIPETPPAMDGMPRAGAGPDPVGRIVAQMDEKIRDLAAWVSVTDRTFERYKNTELGDLMTLRYVRRMASRTVAERLHVSQQRYYDWRTEILIYAAFLASELGILKIA